MLSSGYDSERKIWSGPIKPTIYNANVSLGYLILEVLKTTPDRITQVSADNGYEMTCHEMRVRTIKVASYLKKSGFKQGDVVGIMASNSENLAPVVFACFTIGLPVNTLAPIMTESDIVHMYSRTKPKIIFCDLEVVEMVQKAVAKMAIDPMIVTLVDKAAEIDFVDDIVSGAYDIDSFVDDLCSSGTTGLPKGVCKSHAQVIIQMHPMWNDGFDKQEVMFNFSTIYWVTGMSFLIIGSLYGAKRVITARSFSTSLCIEILDRFKVSTLISPPFMIAMLVKDENAKPFESVKVLMLGGMPVAESLIHEAATFLPNCRICTRYGMTEGDILSNSFFFRRYGSVGKPSPNVQIRILDDAGNCLGPNMRGEVLFKTPVAFSGYFDDPEKSAETIIDGWVHSGDVGYFDDDGFLFLVDRKKGILKYNNYEVYPSELESIINGIDGVTSSCVVGVQDEFTGNDMIFGFVVKDPNSNLDESFIANYVKDRVIDAKQLRGGVHFLDKFPVSINGKTQKEEIRKIAQSYAAKKL